MARKTLKVIPAASIGQPMLLYPSGISTSISRSPKDRALP